MSLYARLVPRGARPPWLAPLAIAVACVATLAVTAIPIRIAGANPGAAFRRYLITPLMSRGGIDEVLLASVPLLLCGLAVAVAFRAGYSNIGAEGQYIAGTIGTTIPGLYLADLPAPIALPLALAAGACAGALWALLPAWLRRSGGIDEVVTTLLLNPVALLFMQGLLTGPWRHPDTGFPDSARLGDGYNLPALADGWRVHWGIIIAFVLLGVTGLVMARTPTGVRLKAAGSAPVAARASGINVDRIVFRSALVSGAIAGLAGSIQVLGVQHQLSGGLANGYGYTGIVVATLGGLGAGGVAIVGLLLGDITVGAQNAARSLQLPPQMGTIVTAVLLLTVVSAMVFTRYRLVIRRASREEAS